MKTTVLVVDDSRMFRELIKETLEESGYDVLLAENGRQALEIYKRDDVQIVVTDLEMPLMSGVELCWHIRAGDDQHRTFNILMTGDTDTVRRIEAFDSGADEFLTKPIDLAMLRARVRAGERITQMHRTMVGMLNTDYLTGVSNRRHFMDGLEKAFAGHRQEKTSYAIAMFDIDHFKSINDTHGHSTGDLALKSFSRNCQSLVPPGGFLGRLGGEEFGLCFPAEDLDGALDRIETIRTETGKLVVEDGSGVTFSFTVSVGVCLFKGASSVGDLMSQADEALYFAKRSGRDRTVVCGTEGMTVKARFYVM